MAEKETRDESRRKDLARVERLERIANNPKVPKLIGKLASLDARWWRSLIGLSDRIDSWGSRSEQRRKDRGQVLDEKIIGAVGKLHRTRDGEPIIIPPSEEVSTFDPLDHIISDDEDLPPDPSLPD